MKIVFMGTPAFSVPALHSLLDSNHEVVAIYTQPPKPIGRGHKEQLSIIHQIALEHNLKVYTPFTFRRPEVQQEFLNIQCDIAIVAAYGLILPSSILTAPKYGFINIHPSLLPRWRGAAPIPRTILAGDKESGVCIMQLVQELDAGAILASYKISLKDNVISSELHDKLSRIGAELLLTTLNDIDHIKAIPQDSSGVTYAAKLSKQEGHIKWNDSAQDIHRKIRALNPWPGVYFIYNNETIKILEASYQDIEIAEEIGTVLDDRLTIKCGKGILQPKILQRPGRKALNVEDFLRGFSIPQGKILF